MNYINPIDQSNPFLTTPPVVIVARHVRVIANGEVVAEDALALHRYPMRIDAHRTFPQPRIDAPAERNVPDHGLRKKPF